MSGIEAAVAALSPLQKLVGFCASAAMFGVGIMGLFFGYSPTKALRVFFAIMGFAVFLGGALALTMYGASLAPDNGGRLLWPLQTVALLMLWFGPLIAVRIWSKRPPNSVQPPQPTQSLDRFTKRPDT